MIIQKSLLRGHRDLANSEGVFIIDQSSTGGGTHKFGQTLERNSICSIYVNVIIVQKHGTARFGLMLGMSDYYFPYKAIIATSSLQSKTE